MKGNKIGFYMVIIDFIVVIELGLLKIVGIVGKKNSDGSI